MCEDFRDMRNDPIGGRSILLYMGRFCCQWMGFKRI